MKFILISNSVEFIKTVDRLDDIRIMVDLELLGKKERQKNKDTFITTHVLKDVKTMRDAFPNVELMVRVNPMNPQSAREIDEVLEFKPEFIMVPMARTSDELELAGKFIANRAGLIPLVETSDALNNIERISQIRSVTELYLGLNDLHLDLKLKFMFELLSNGEVEKFAKAAGESDKPFGFGGASTLGTGDLPAEYVLAEHHRLGSTRVILSRSFHKNAQDINKNITDLRSYVKKLESLDSAEILGLKSEGDERIKQIAKRLSSQA